MKSIRVIAALGVAVLFGQGCLADPAQPNRPIFFDFKQDQASPAPTPPTPALLPPGPPVATGEISSQSENVVVSSPAPAQELPNPFVILGRGRAFESVVNWRVTDERGTVLGEGAVMTTAPDVGMFGDYRVRAFYRALPLTQNGTVQVFTYSARDGSEQDVVRIPVRLVQDTIPVQVFFVSQEGNPNLERCDDPVPFTRRIPKTQNVAEAALLELMEGPTVAEDVYGARTGIAPGTGVRSVNIEGDTATADFSRELVTGIAGSCQVGAVRSQIERTLMQFPNIRQTRIWVEGTDAEILLQP